MKKHFPYTLLFCLCLLGSKLSGTPVAVTAMMEEVYGQLKGAIGDTERVWPKLEIRPGANSVLAYNKRKNIIFVDEKALEVCQSFGRQQKDAFAFLLAHEMTHFYQEHHWQEAGFATSFLTNRHNFAEHVADEKEADLFGAFVTHIAGYESIKMVPTIFDKIYTAYGLTEQLQDYPSLPKRKSTALEVCEKVKELIQVFETANYLTTLGEYISAAAAYEYVLQFVKYKELYNNIGASLVAAAALQPEYGELAFRFPIELDLDIPLRDGADAEKSELLQKAIEYLTIASRMDNQHYRTFINLICAYTLNKEYEKAKTLMEQLNKIPNLTNQHKANLVILKGINYALENPDDKATASTIFTEALKYGHTAMTQELVRENYSIVLNGEPRGSTLSFKMGTSTTSKIDGIDLTYENELPFKNILLANSFSETEQILGILPTQNGVLVHLQTEDKTIAIHSTNQQTTAEGIDIGATLQDLGNIYQSYYAKNLSHSNGYYRIYPKAKLFFNLNKAEKVTAWGIYEIY